MTIFNFAGLSVTKHVSSTAIKARKKKEEEEGIEHDQIEATIPVDTSTDKPIEPEKEEAPPVVVNDNNEEKKEEEQTEEHNENQ